MKSRTMRLLSAPAQQTTSVADSAESNPPKKSVQLVVPAFPGETSGAGNADADQSGATPPMFSWDPFSRSCMSRDLFDTIGDKWAMLILLSIENGPLRNGEIRDRVQGISPKILTQRLGVLVEDGLVTRTSHHQIPPRVDYELTELGESVIAPVKSVYAWTVSHMDEVIASRKRAPRAS